MVSISGETYLLASEAARHLNVSRVKFYLSYKASLKPVLIGELRRKYYRKSELEIMHRVKDLPVAS